MTGGASDGRPSALGEGSAPHDVNAQHVEEIPAHASNPDLFRIAVTGQRGGCGANGADGFQRRRRLCELRDLRSRQLCAGQAGRAHVGPEKHQAVGGAVGRRLNEKRVDDRIHGGVRSDADRQRQKDRGEQAGSAAQAPERVRGIAHDAIQCRFRAHAEPRRTQRPDIALITDDGATALHEGTTARRHDARCFTDSSCLRDVVAVVWREAQFVSERWWLEVDIFTRPT